MQNILISLGWAAAIIAAAYFGKQHGLSDEGSMALVFALVGAAVATLKAGPACKSC